MSFLYDYQRDAVERLKNGAILCGGVGSGKSRTALAYYFEKECKGELDPDYIPMREPKDLYIITTALKRDKLEWEGECSPFLLPVGGQHELYPTLVKIDSWNNIKKYIDVENAFFIFDEQRVVGYGAWTKAFLKIAKKNRWILLSATPGDRWTDYIPVFIANGFYKNKTEFVNEHVVYAYGATYPKIDHFVGQGTLLRLRNDILVTMDYERPTIQHNNFVLAEYDLDTYREIARTRWNPETNAPCKNASEYCLLLRKIVNADPSRATIMRELHDAHPKMIVFYNFNYELDILRGIDFGKGTMVAEWNGHKHEPIPEGDNWVYLVQYNAGAEGWNCITTDTIVFFSLNHSYRIMKQASGRIDRANTPYTDLYYYYLRSGAAIDSAIKRALSRKKDFNESAFAEPGRRTVA